ncbi:MAG: chemotaxis protein [Eubacteriales bacterium]|nr:chemotaxis protein [Eubacteriales bacterium]
MEFTINGCSFGINVAKILEIMQYTEVTTMPNSSPYVEGVFKPREDVITIINLASYMGLTPSEDPSRDIFIITVFNNVYTAFHVHSVEEIHKISWEDIEKPDTTIYSGEEGLATGIARIGDKLITILDFEKILADISPDKSIQVSDIEKLGERTKSGKPILLAEDSPLLEKLLVECLHKSQYTNTTICSNGKVAWDLLLEYKKEPGPIEDKVACIVTDLEMPKMDGHRLLKFIREDEDLKHIPVIIFSSLINDEMRLKGERLGATAQITKPEIANLVSLIDKYIL